MQKTFLVTSIFLLSISAHAEGNKNLEGFYGGVQVGAIEHLGTYSSKGGWWGDDFNNVEIRDTTVSLGLKLGYDKLSGSFLYGALAEGSILDINKKENYLSNSFEIGSKLNTLGSVRAKFGIASDKLSVFATGGLAFADIKHNYREIEGAQQSYYNEDGKNYGYVVGVGTSYLITDNSTIGLDVSRYVFGSKTHGLRYGATGDSPGNLIEGQSFTQDDVINSVNVSYTMKF